MKRLWLPIIVFTLAAVLFQAGRASADYVDHAPPNATLELWEEVWMHVCAPGYAIAGVHVGNNWFLCRAVDVHNTDDLESYVDKSNQRYGMHACVLGYYMRGLHVGNNWLLCTRYLASDIEPPDADVFWLARETLDPPDDGWPPTEESDMHSCPRDVPSNPHHAPPFLTGIHVGNDVFICSWKHPSQPSF